MNQKIQWLRERMKMLELEGLIDAVISLKESGLDAVLDAKMAELTQLEIFFYRKV